MVVESTYNNIEDFLNKIQSNGRFSVTLKELKNNFDSSEKAILQNIFRLKRKNQLAQVRKEFYVIVPPQYSNRGMIPSTLFIGDLMEFLERDYYVGLMSASALHGAGHQQPMQFQVMTTKPSLRNIKNNKLNIHFFVKSKWQEGDINQKKTGTGYINVSSPALTAFDLIHYNKKIGGLNRIIPILEDLMENIRTSDLKRTAKGQKFPEIQRLGFILDALGNDQLATALYKRIEGKPLKVIPLSLAHKKREGELNSKWKVILNSELDF
jgi:predicted transcriptional regulator of viral defense system